MSRLLIILFLLFAAAKQVWAQHIPAQESPRYLVLDKPGQVKRIRFYVGDRLTFKLKGERTKYSAEITDILTQAVVFGDAIIPVSEFSTIHYTKRSYWAYMAQSTSQNGKVAGIAFSGLGAAATAVAPSHRNARSLLWGGLTVLGASQLMRPFYQRAYRLNHFRKLHIIETPYAEAPGP